MIIYVFILESLIQPFPNQRGGGNGRERGGERALTDLSGVVVPQLLVEAVGVGLLPLDLGDDVEHV